MLSPTPEFWSVGLPPFDIESRFRCLFSRCPLLMLSYVLSSGLSVSFLNGDYASLLHRFVCKGFDGNQTRNCDYVRVSHWVLLN